MLIPKTLTPFVVGLLTILMVLSFSLSARGESVKATYYSDEYVGVLTASGELYDPNAYTAAHPYLPFGTELLVSYNDRSVVVRVNDSCSCGLDLSLAAAQAIGLTEVGIAAVEVEILSTEAVPMPPPPTDTLQEEVGAAQEVPDGEPSVEALPSSTVALEEVEPPTLP